MLSVWCLLVFFLTNFVYSVQGKTSYTIEIKIADEEHAGTNDDVSVVIYGKSGDFTKRHKLDKWFKDDFERNSRESYDINDDVDVGEISCVEILADGGNSFLVEEVIVGKKDSQKITLLNTENSWLADDEREKTQSSVQLCVPCEVGNYANTPTTCAPCPVNSYADSPGQTTCNPCPAGSESKTLGSSSCVPVIPEENPNTLNRELVTEKGLDLLKAEKPPTEKPTDKIVPVIPKENPDTFKEKLVTEKVLDLLKAEIPPTEKPTDMKEENIDTLKEEIITEKGLDLLKAEIPPSEKPTDIIVSEGTLTVMLCKKLYFKDCNNVQISPYRPSYQVKIDEIIKSIMVIGKAEPLTIFSSLGREHTVYAPFYDHDLSDTIGDLSLSLEIGGGIITSIKYGNSIAKHLDQRFGDEFGTYEWIKVVPGKPAKSNIVNIHKIFVAAECRSSLVEKPDIFIKFLSAVGENVGILHLRLGIDGFVDFKISDEAEDADNKYELDTSNIKCDDGDDLIYKLEILAEGISVLTQAGISLLEPQVWPESKRVIDLFAETESVVFNINYNTELLRADEIKDGPKEITWIAIQENLELGWKNKSSEKVPCDLEGENLEIKTDNLSSSEFIQVYLFTKDNEEISKLTIWPLNEEFFVSGCTKDTIRLTNVPSGPEKSWIISKSDNSITVLCDDIEVLNFVFTDVDAKNFPQCASSLNKDVAKIQFVKDTATYLYRCGKEDDPQKLAFLNDTASEDFTPTSAGVLIARKMNFVTINSNEVLTESPTTEPFNMSQSSIEVQAILTNNITLKVREEGDEKEGIPVYRPKFEGKIPIGEIEKKTKEYQANRTSSNLLGYLTYNGYTDFGINKIRDKKGDFSLDINVDEEVVLEAVRSFQRFNGFPETGDLTATQIEVFNNKGCGNKGIDYNQQKSTFYCKGGEYASDGKEGLEISGAVRCPNKHKRFKNCVILPSSLELDEFRQFVHNDNYFFETDIHFLTQQKYEHVALAFNYNKKTSTADYIYFKYFRKRMCFSYGKYLKRGLRRHVGSPRKCFKPSKEQKIIDQYKLRVDVSHNKAYVSVNNWNIFNFTPSNPSKSAAFLFTLDGVYYRKNRLRMITSRICRRRDHEDSYSRTKRFVLSEHKWSARQIQYAFVNFSSSLGPELTRTEILRAIDVYSSSAKLSFREVPPKDANKHADITFMFIRGRHFDGLEFYGPGDEKGHAYVPVHGEIHFNDYEVFSAEKEKDTTSLFYVALHEIGHTLGLAHSELHDAVMHKDYDEEKAYSFKSFHFDDTDAIAEHYKELMSLLYSGANNRLEDINLTENTAYNPKHPFPRECHNKIEAAFHYYSRHSHDSDAYYLFTNGFLWKYSALDDAADSGFPKRVSEVFSGIEDKVDAAFDTGKLIYIISRNSVYEYKLIPNTDIIARSNTGTLSSMFGIPGEPVIQSAFNDYKTSTDKKLVKTTLVVSKTLHYRITWSKGKLRQNTERIDNPTDIIGEEFSATEFNAAFEWERTLKNGETRFEVVQFDTKRTARSKVPYPGDSYQKRTATYDVPELFSIDGWCRKDINSPL